MQFELGIRLRGFAFEVYRAEHKNAVREPAMKEILEIGRQVIAQQPFVQSLGMELTSAQAGKTEFRAPVTHTLTQHLEFIHGGALLSIADTAMSFAGGSVLGVQVVTSELKINFVRPAKGQTIIARAEVISSSKRQAVVRCDVFTCTDDLETLVAVLQGTIALISDAP
jgi:uncharacterized protein (TIGR00369 family)